MIRCKSLYINGTQVTVSSSSDSSDVIKCSQIKCSSEGTRDEASVYCYNIWASDIECGDIECNRIYSSVAGESWSDYRLKNQINKLNLETMKNIILSLNPVSYELNQFKGKLHFGLIAQEVENTLKENKIKESVIYSIRDNGYYALAYDELIAPIIATLQYQYKEFIQIKNDYLQLKKQLN